ncbi:MAG: polysaccharide deacetylase, partial [Myxococcales bacterium]|nr:polysaccharide deacetylase [Myxococcales bacterium]
PPPPPPSSAYVVYDDALEGGFEDWSWAKHTLSQSAVVHSGAAAISFAPVNWDGLYFHHSGVDTTGFGSIELYVNGGPGGGQDIILAVYDGQTLLGEVDIPQWLGHALRAGIWEHVVVPLSTLGVSGRPLRDLYVQDNSGSSTQATVYVDDVRLIP